VQDYLNVRLEFGPPNWKSDVAYDNVVKHVNFLILDLISLLLD